MPDLRQLVRRYVAAGWRYRWPAVFFAWFICAAGWTLTFLIPNQYESSARLYVNADAVLTPLLKGLAVENDPAAQLDILQRTLLSRPNLQKLVSTTDLDLQVHSPTQREQMVQDLAHQIVVTPQTKNLFTITYRDTSPKLAAQVVQAVLTTFIESNTGQNRNDMAAASKFLENQIASYEGQLREVEKRRAEFRSKYIDLLPGQDGGSSRLDASRGRVQQVEGQLQDALAKRAMLTKELSTTQPLVTTEELPGMPGSPGSSAVRLADAERNLAELRTRDTDQHPAVIAAGRLVEALRTGKVPGDPSTAAASPRSRGLPNPVYEQLKLANLENEATIASLTRQAGEARQERDTLETIARGAPGLQAEYTNMNRDYDVLRTNFDKLLGRRESMRIGRAADAHSDQVKIQVVDPPQVPNVPVAPKRILFVVAVLIAGIAGGVGLAVMLVTLDQSFHTVGDLSALGLPVAGAVSMLSRARSSGEQLASGATFALAAMLPAFICAGLLYRVLTHPNFPA
ncbi:MAG: hypothetical protein M3Y41_06200 [Pseudomonadota bacterium]|nr:hypothetical protein [Pseudomonadota bacterium]